VGCDRGTVRYIFNHFPIGEKCREKGAKWRDAEIERAYAKAGKHAALSTVESTLPAELSADDLFNHFKAYTFKSTEFLKMKFPKRKMLIAPWLKKGSVNMLFGPSGIGKSLFAHCLAACLTTWKAAGLNLPSMGPWDIKARCPVFILDGELPEEDIQRNVKAFRVALGRESDKFPLHIYSSLCASRESGLRINIVEEKIRESIFRFMKEGIDGSPLLIVDNLVSLTPGVDEDKKVAWDPLNQFFLRCIAEGFTVLIIHHTNKKNAQRGTSARENNLDVVVSFSRTTDYDASQGSLFKVKFEKTRGMAPSKALKPFTLKLIGDGSGGLTWETGKANEKPEDQLIIALLLDGKLKQKRIAELNKVTPMTVTNRRKDAVKRKLVVGKGKKAKLTKAGKKFLADHKFEVAKFYQDNKVNK
jgi:KaiC/GvpD/RAD55 family RecA-like ATPase